MRLFGQHQIEKERRGEERRRGEEASMYPVTCWL
jgi:hypothetical protein